MGKLTSSLYFKSFLVALCVLTFGSIGVLAVMDPQCSHCTLSIAYKAMTGAKILAGGWLFAGTIFCWDSRQTIYNKVETGLQLVRTFNSSTKNIKA